MLSTSRDGAGVRSSAYFDLTTFPNDAGYDELVVVRDI